MSQRNRIALVVVWVASLVAAAVMGYAQAPMQRVEPLPPMVISGGDIGFRVEGRRGDTPVGRVVIRKNSQAQWVDVEFAVGGVKKLGPLD